MPILPSPVIADCDVNLLSSSSRHSVRPLLAIDALLLLLLLMLPLIAAPPQHKTFYVHIMNLTFA